MLQQFAEPRCKGVVGIYEVTPAISAVVDLHEVIVREQFIRYLDSLNWISGRTKHIQTFFAFLRAASLSIDPAIARSEVLRRIIEHEGIVDDYQVSRQQQRAMAYVTDQALSLETSPSRSRSQMPVFSPDVLKRIAVNVSIDDPKGALRKVSPLPVAEVTATNFLDHLFYRDEKVIVFTTMKSQGQVIYQVGSDTAVNVPHGSSGGVWFLVQPVDGLEHPNPRQGGKLSRRSEESVTSWRYLVLESDEADTGDWLRAIVQLPLRIVAVYTSGGRSIHCLIRVDASSKAEWDTFKNTIKPIVVTLGADDGALSAVRLSRLPQCWRGDHRQELLYLAPDADGTPIAQRLELAGHLRLHKGGLPYA